MTTKQQFSQRAAWAVGQPISELMARALANPELISLAAGFVDSATLPVEFTADAMSAIFADETTARRALQYGSTPGCPELRHLIMDRICQEDELPAGTLDYQQVVLTAGSNQLLHLVAESILNTGDIVISAAPTYFVFLGMLANLGARTCGVPTDDEGILPWALDELLQRLESQEQLPRVKALYLVSYYDNPQGITISLRRRQELLDVIRRWRSKQNILIIEDAAYRELRYAGDAVPSMLSLEGAADHVVYAGTFSKSFSPGVRVGWGILPVSLVDPVCNQKGNIDFGSPHFNQLLMLTVIKNGWYDPHIDSIRQSYGVKLQAMLTAIDQYIGAIDGVTWVRPRGGLYVWLELPPAIDTGPDGVLADRAVSEGVLYVPGQYCYPSSGSPVKRNTMRLSFGVQSPERIVEGIEKLGRAIRSVL